MDRHDLAWAAGFFDGEGWANRAKRGVHARINQAGPDGMPGVLVKFHGIVGVGRLRGPQVKDGKQDLYWWEATSRPDVARVADQIGPWLCSVKRAQFEHTLGRSLAPATSPVSMSEELAWAGGFFDADGSTYLEKHRSHEGYFVPRLHVSQSSDVGIAPELVRLSARSPASERSQGAIRAKASRVLITVGAPSPRRMCNSVYISFGRSSGW